VGCVRRDRAPAESDGYEESVIRGGAAERVAAVASRTQYHGRAAPPYATCAAAGNFVVLFTSGSNLGSVVILSLDHPLMRCEFERIAPRGIANSSPEWRRWVRFGRKWTRRCTRVRSPFGRGPPTGVRRWRGRSVRGPRSAPDVSRLNASIEVASMVVRRNLLFSQAGGGVGISSAPPGRTAMLLRQL
jgi:hypothetical protein